jgi:hypothetical protein
VQLESLHPFLDGNGRLGRLLITLHLCSQEVLHQPLLSLSLPFKRHRQTCYRLLQEVRERGNGETWLEFFLEGAWLRLANARKVLGENDKAVAAYARADAIAALAPAQLADWTEAHVRLIKPGAAPAPEAVAVLERRRPSSATRWRCSISAPRSSPGATGRRPRGAGRRCWRCCLPTRRYGRCWKGRSRRRVRP